jgi:pimeloyl-ACP methyl ester carboxylesterase
MPTATNVVLVHGAYADGSSWSKVIPVLQNKGFRVTAVQLPLTSLANDIEATRRILAMQKGATALVGHSYGGAVMTEAGADAPNVVSLVYAAAFAPDAGESAGDLANKGPPPAGVAHIRPDSDGFLWLDPDGFRDAFASDVDEVLAGVMAVVQKPIAAVAFGAKLSKAAWKERPCWYQISEIDLMIPPDLQRFMAQRIGATTISLKSSHASIVSHPNDVADLIVRAAQDTDIR